MISSYFFISNILSNDSNFSWSNSKNMTNHICSTIFVLMDVCDSNESINVNYMILRILRQGQLVLCHLMVQAYLMRTAYFMQHRIQASPHLSWLCLISPQMSTSVMMMKVRLNLHDLHHSINVYIF